MRSALSSPPDKSPVIVWLRSDDNMADVDVETCSGAMQGVSLDESVQSRPSPTPHGNPI